MMIREAVQADADAMAKLHRNSRQTAMPGLPMVHTPEEDLWFFRTIVLAKDQVRVACNDTQVIGFVSFRDQWVNHLYVDPAHWRQGVGTRLLDIAKSSNERLELWTFQQNHIARRFYAAHGFEEREFTDGQGCEEKAPDVRLVWSAVQ